MSAEFDELRPQLRALIASAPAASSPVASSYWRQHLEQFDADDPLRRRSAGRTAFPGLASYSSVRVPDVAFRVVNFLLAPRGRRRIFRSDAYRAVRAVTRRQRRHLDFDAVKHAYVLDTIEHLVSPRASTVCVIGDGLANFVAPALRLSDSYARVISVNLPEVLLADTHLLEEAGIDGRDVRVVRDGAALGAACASPGVRLVLVPAALASALSAVHIDGFVNVSSMQEMHPSVIDDYFSTIRASGGWFYCCNKVSKRLPDGVVTRFADYPWGDARWLLGPEQCPWYLRAPSLRPPFVTHFSPTTHGLASYAGRVVS